MKKHGKKISTLNEFVSAIKKQFYPLAYMQQAMMSWQTLCQLKGQSVQRYTQEFRKIDLALGISLDSPETLLKYISGLHIYLKHTILMFNATSLDDVLVQATHLEARGKNVNPEIEGSSKPSASKKKEKKKLRCKERKRNALQNDKTSCTHCKKCYIHFLALQPQSYMSVNQGLLSP